jgi:hypothetical protein
MSDSILIPTPTPVQLRAMLEGMSEIPDRLLKRNHERYAEEVTRGCTRRRNHETHSAAEPPPRTSRKHEKTKTGKRNRGT